MRPAPASVLLPLLVFGLGLVLYGLVVPAGTEPAEWRRTYYGYLPDTDEEGVAVLLVVDERTGRPVEGALVRRHFEYDLGRDGWAPGQEERVTDEFGLAWLEIPEDERITGHWAVHKEGYAPEEAYGAVPNETVQIHAGRDLHGVILDAAGLPARGVRLEYKRGCAHAPALRVAHTDAQGRFVLPCVSIHGEAVYTGRGVLSGYWNTCDIAPQDEAPAVEVTYAGVRLQGRVVGVDVEDLGIAMMQAYVNSRGPVAPIGPDGRFVLEGVQRDTMLELWCLDNGEPDTLKLGSFRSDAPIEWDVSPGAHAARESAATFEVPVQVLEAELGALARPVEVSFDRVRDGRRFQLRLEDWEEEPKAVRLPAGTYDVDVGSPFGAWRTGSRVRVEVTAARQEPVVLHAERQPALEIEWRPRDLEEQVEAHVALIGADGRFGGQDLASVGYLPAKVPAVLSVHRGGITRFLPVLPQRDGVRRVTVTWPEPKRLRVQVPAGPVEVRIRGGEVDWMREGGEVVVSTWLAGRVRVAFTLGPADDEHEVVRLVDVPDQPGAEVRLRPVRRSGRRDGDLRVLHRDGRPAAGYLVRLERWNELDEDFDSDWPLELDADGRLRNPLARDGTSVVIESSDEADEADEWLRFRTTLHGKGPYEVRIPDGRLVLEVRSATGRLPENICTWFVGHLDMLDVGPGVEPGDTHDRVVFANLPAGRHRVVVGAQGHLCEALQVELQEGETRSLEVVLRLRE